MSDQGNWNKVGTNNKMLCAEKYYPTLLNRPPNQQSAPEWLTYAPMLGIIDKPKSKSQSNNKPQIHHHHLYPTSIQNFHVEREREYLELDII